jgi:hypothetical protein
MRISILMLLASLGLTSCISRKEVLAEVWLQSGLPPELCEKYPEIKAYGQYRELNTGKFENISYCAQIPGTLPDGSQGMVNAVSTYFGFQKDKFNAILNELLPEHPAKAGESR